MLDQFDQQYTVFQRIRSFRKIPGYDSLFQGEKSAWKEAGTIIKYINNLTEELVSIGEMLEDSDERVVAIANIMEQYRLIQKDDGSFVILEVKGNHMIDNPVVKAKEAAAEEMAVESSMKYELIKGSDIAKGKSGY